MSVRHHKGAVQISTKAKAGICNILSLSFAEFANFLIFASAAAAQRLK